MQVRCCNTIDKGWRRVGQGVVALLGLLMGLASPGQAGERLLFEGESPYVNVRVFERDDGLRYLAFGVFEQTVMRMSDPTYLHYPYTRSAMAGFALLGRPARKALLMGLGGGTMATFVARYFPEISFDAIEIDPLVVDLARQYFNLREGPQLRVQVGDGRVLLRRSKERYDLIFLDAYKADGIPFHLTTREFLTIVRDHLAADGVVGMHLWGRHVNAYFDAQMATLQEVFPTVWHFDAGEGSHLIFATPQVPGLDRGATLQQAQILEREHNLPLPLEALVAKQYRRADKAPATAKVLTDDHAPVDLLREMKSSGE